MKEILENHLKNAIKFKKPTDIKKYAKIKQEIAVLFIGYSTNSTSSEAFTY